ncbi:MAG: acetate--CoA ligase family protein [bacterium]
MKSLDVILRPRSVAVVGASTRTGRLGREIFDKLLNTDFNGPLYPVNPKARYIHSVKAYASIADIPDPVDLAVIIVPKEHVLPIVRECASHGVKGLVVLTAGFRETGEQGARVEQEIIDIVKAHDMRLVGPNCMGVFNLETDVRLDATFAPIVPLDGNIALASQSGALGQTILEHAKELNLGISMFVSVGNKADVSGNDLLEYWGQEASIEVILMYLESFGNPRRFIQLAKKVSRKKPIIIVKSGRTSSGARAATSHTGALAGMDVAYDALFKQCGVIRADTINEMFDYAMGFANVPLPAGNRVAIITNAGGPGIMAADACESCGLHVAQFTETTQEQLRARLLAEASINNPVDLLAGAQPEEFQFALRQVLVDANVDAAIVIFVAPIITNPEHVALRIARASQEFDKPVLGCFMGVKGVATGIAELNRQRIPAFPFPESAAKTLAAMVNYTQWRNRSSGRMPRYRIDKDRAQQLIHSAVHEGREYLSPQETLALTTLYGIPFVKSQVCKSLSEIQSVARGLRFPLALKVASDKVVHKSEVGGVKLHLRNDRDLASAFAALTRSLAEKGIADDSVNFVVQEMVTGGREVIMGLTKAERFGTLLAFGMGGIYVEVLQDMTFRITPATDLDVEQMVREIRGYPILAGIRGEKPVALPVLKETLLRLSQMAIDLPQIQELDLNPFIVFSEAEKCVAVDVRIRIEALCVDRNVLTL